MKSIPMLAAVPLMLLAACERSTPETQPEGSATTAALPPPPVFPEAGPSPAPSPTAIPAAIQGRWGMVPADCEPNRPDAKGLLVIDGTTLEFYESVGTLDDVEEASGTRIRAGFDFTGEGMEWEREVTLELQDGGRTLVRHEQGPDGAPGPFRYAKCG